MGKFVDLTGMRFGDLFVIGEKDNRVNGHIVWNCKCSCGKYKDAPTYLLNSGVITHCGHIKREAKFNDVSGARFGKLTVIRRVMDEKTGWHSWECLCDCGNYTVVSYRSLITGGTKTCGDRKCREGDLSGMVFGELAAIEFIKTSNTTGKWLCKCSCGKSISVIMSHLTSGRVKSCGHLIGVKKNLVGMKFGYLTVAEYAGKDKSRGTLWHCICRCGKSSVVKSYFLTSGHTKSCGCMSSYLKSVGHITHGLCYTKEYKNMKSRERKELEFLFDSKWTLEMEKLLSEMFPNCVVCGGDYRVAVDHVKPLSKKNGLIPGNAVRLCQSCNSIKGPRELSEIPEDMANKILIAAEEFRQRWYEEHPEQ